MQARGGGQRFAYVYITPPEGRRVKDATRALVNHPGHNYADAIAIAHLRMVGEDLFDTFAQLGDQFFRIVLRRKT